MLQPTAPQWMLDATSSRVEVAVRHLLTTVHGRFERFSVDLSVDAARWPLSSVSAMIDVASIDTGLALRDDHLRELFDVKRCPYATFTSHSVDREGDMLRVNGDLTLRGRTRSVEVRAVAAMSERRIVFDASFRLSREAFGVCWSAPVELTSGVADVVDVSMRVVAVR